MQDGGVASRCNGSCKSALRVKKKKTKEGQIFLECLDYPTMRVALIKIGALL